MKSFIAIALLAGAALAAPPQSGTKPFKEAQSNIPRDDCWQTDPGESIGTPSEDCAGTIEYCLRGWYVHHGEPFADDDACLRSRGLDPATAVEGLRIASESDYYDGVIAMSPANRMLYRQLLIENLRYASVPEGMDRDGDLLVEWLLQGNAERGDKVREAVEAAKKKLKPAFAPGSDAKLDAAIKETQGKLEAAAKELARQSADLVDVFTDKTEAKYYHPWA